MRSSSLLLAAFSTLALTAACGSQVIDAQQTTGTTSGAGGATTSTTGVGGDAGGTTGTTMSGTTTATSTGAGGAPTICGGKIGTPCGPDEYCDFGEGPTPCGFADGTGICQPKPQGCPADCPGVCGCDGNFYCNECGAHASGVDVNPDNGCFAAEDFYRAVNLFTGVPRYAILKLSPSRNLCFRLVVEPTMSVGIGIYGDGWAVKSADVTSDVNDCDFPPGTPTPPVGATFAGTSAMGGLYLTIASAGCQAGINAAVKFDGAPAWAPMEESFYLGQPITIEGGCP